MTMAQSIANRPQRNPTPCRGLLCARYFKTGHDFRFQTFRRRRCWLRGGNLFLGPSKKITQLWDIFRVGDCPLSHFITLPPAGSGNCILHPRPLRGLVLQPECIPPHSSETSAPQWVISPNEVVSVRIPYRLLFQILTDFSSRQQSF